MGERGLTILSMFWNRLGTFRSSIRSAGQGGGDYVADAESWAAGEVVGLGLARQDERGVQPARLLGAAVVGLLDAARVQLRDAASRALLQLAQRAELDRIGRA